MCGCNRKCKFSGKSSKRSGRSRSIISAYSGSRINNSSSSKSCSCICFVVIETVSLVGKVVNVVVELEVIIVLTVVVVLTVVAATIVLLVDMLL